MPKKKDAKSILSKHWKELKELKKLPSVLSIDVSSSYIDGKKAGIESIIIYVTNEIKSKLLVATNVIPKEIDGINVEVVVLSSDDYKIGKTSVSNLSPDEQRRRVSGVIKK